MCIREACDHQDDSLAGRMDVAAGKRITILVLKMVGARSPSTGRDSCTDSGTTVVGGAFTSVRNRIPVLGQPYPCRTMGEGKRHTAGETLIREVRCWVPRALSLFFLVGAFCLFANRTQNMSEGRRMGTTGGVSARLQTDPGANCKFAGAAAVAHLLPPAMQQR